MMLRHQVRDMNKISTGWPKKQATTELSINHIKSY